jgi:ethanolamine kinase
MPIISGTSSVPDLCGPSGYAIARSELHHDAEPHSNKMGYVNVESRPYFPMLDIDPSNEASMVDSARTILNAYYSSDDCNTSDRSIELQPNVTRISGGLTNALFKVDFTDRSILIRIFGADGMIDRDIETATLARLCGPPHHNNGQGGKPNQRAVHPKLDMIGRFANGRIESWIPNMKQSTISDFDSSLMGGMARALARLHYGFEVPSYLYGDECREVDGRRERVRVLRPSLWDVIYSWIEELEGALSRDEFNDEELLQLFCQSTLGKTGASKEEMISNLMHETNWLQSMVQQKHPNATVAFTHNDLCTANILLDQCQCQDAEPCIIDYEYGSVSYTMFDIANFFCELCGGNDNGVPNLELFPCEERQRKFLTEYVNEMKHVLQNQEENSAFDGNDILESQKQIQLFQMASNLLWGVWGVLQACGEVNETFCKEDARLRLDGKIDADSFDYLRYGTNRLKNYRVCKERL